MRSVWILMLGVIVIVGSSMYAADWPQYRGVDQDGVSSESLGWTSGDLKTVWKVSADRGFSSYAICDGKVFTQVIRDVDGNPREVCIAQDAASGKELWFADIGIGKGYSGGF